MKKIFSILLVIIFFLGILPTNVLADNANIFTNKAMLTVKAVPNFTSLRIYQRVGVTTTATGGTAPYMYANYVIKDGKIIYRGWYGTSNIFYYVPKTIGTYKITSFVRDVTGAIKYVTTVPIKVTDYTATQPLYVSTATNAAELSAGQNLIVRAVAYGGAGGYNYAFYVRREGTIIYKGNYSTNNIFSYILTDAGSYDVLCFVKDRLGEIVCRSTRQVSAIVAPNPKYRALIIGQHNYWDHTLAGTDVDANNMNTMFITKPPYGTMAKLTKKLDLTGRGILSTIPVAFAGADSSSVSVFYYSGHGSDNGYIFGVDNNYPGSGAVSSTELANALKQIPGKIVVILDSCHSGYHINKSTGVDDIAAFNVNVINAFKAVDVVSKTPGQMATTKFHVLTAASQTEYSWGSEYGGVFTNAILQSTDGDDNGFISMYEAYLAAQQYASGPIYSEGQTYYQHVQCYPLNDQLPLWQK